MIIMSSFYSVFYSHRWYCFIYMLGLLIDTAHLHNLIEGVEGESIILPCSHKNIALEEHQITVHWRHKDIRNVYDIIHGRVSVQEQDPAYKNRTTVLPKECSKGDFSLILADLQRSDGGSYLCFVPDAGVFHSVQLVVKERSFSKHTAAQVRSHGTKARLGKTLHFIIPVFGLILWIV
ncbi:HERV-H LTR-associating protein 2 isoform X2 [Xyrauchen texanus]|uniref:HERV-H LTR-associating protein 2 isoform X1 n=1 Tax=Xyrauchen texanus TaxID=154827 RepID=UPI0022426200|nr:HERV-H LTR-associating protein 2 isoform X1 [Xyrauchen texanus]XP_051978183.1 HERV-H LTR-associating protein 2 isoform X2 [Xyrauchen texanus]